LTFQGSKLLVTLLGNRPLAPLILLKSSNFSSQSIPILHQCVSPDLIVQRNIVQGRRHLQSVHRSNSSVSYCFASAGQTKVLNDPQLRVIQEEGRVKTALIGFRPNLRELQEISPLRVNRNGPCGCNLSRSTTASEETPVPVLETRCSKD